MIDDVSDIRDFYDSDPNKEHERLQQNQLEYELTWRFFERYLPAQGSILEVGAASGRYTLELAKRGYQVTAVDLSGELLEASRKRLVSEGFEKQVQLVVADARDLSAVAEKSFDAVLLMGPLYHLVEEDDRKTALKEVFERLRDGGVLFSASISRLGLVGDVMRRIPAWIENQDEVQSIVVRGRRFDANRRGGFRGYYADVSEVAPLHEAMGFETLAVVGVEPGIWAYDESYNALEGKQREMWLDLLYQISGESSIIGASRHLLYIGKKMDGP